MAKVKVTQNRNYTKEHMDMKKRFENYKLMQRCLLASAVINVILIGVLLV